MHAHLPTPVQGFENALKAGATEVAIFTAASEAFNRRNINCSIGVCEAQAQRACLPLALELLASFAVSQGSQRMPRIHACCNPSPHTAHATLRIPTDPLNHSPTTTHPPRREPAAL